MYKLYSQRRKEETGEPEIYKYNNFPTAFRNQFITIIKNVLTAKKFSSHKTEDIVASVCYAFAQEKGLKGIEGYNNQNILYSNAVIWNTLQALEYYLDNCKDKDFLDFVDFIFGCFFCNENFQSVFVNKDIFSYALEELNYRFKQNSLGYEFINGEIICKTNTVTHETIVKPALKLLLDEDFRGAEEEYLLAFEHYRQGQNEDAILNAGKAFESTMKCICTKLGYEFDREKDTAKKLLDRLKSSDFFPSYLEAHLNGVITTLESGVSTLRNKKAGHGQGAEERNVTDEYVQYALNLAASNILFLYQLYQKKKTEG